MTCKWLLTLIPLGVGLAAAGLLAFTSLINPVLYLRIDAGTLALLGGLLLSGLLIIGVLFQQRSERIQRQAIEQTRAKAAADRRRFLQRLDHELKNPLTAIRAGLANLSGDNSPASPEIVTSLEAQILRLSHLTADLRKLAELETLTLEQASVNLAELLEEALTLAQEQPEAEGHHFTLTLPQAPWPLPTISGDGDLLFLTFYNLLSNALKFTNKGDTVEIRAFEDGGTTIVVEVADTGPGIPDDELPHVWEELYRGQGARGVEGSGLGLALARAIVERHGGQITLRSRMGQGTLVAVRLPLE